MASFNDSTASGKPDEQYVFKIKRASNAQFYWTFHNTKGNTEAMAQSETYVKKQSCQESIDKLMQFAATAKVEDLS